MELLSPLTVHVFIAIALLFCTPTQCKSDDVRQPESLERVQGCKIILSTEFNTNQASLQCENVSLQLVNADYLAKPAYVYNNIQLNAVRAAENGDQLIVNDSGITEFFSWTFSDLKSIHLDDLLSSLESRRFLRLRALNLSDNLLSELRPEHLSRIPELRYLNLSKNKLVQLQHDVFGSIRNLIELDLSENGLHSIVGDGNSLFQNQNELLHLNISHNNIDDLPRGIAFHGLTSLVSLDMSHNKLFVVPFQIFRQMGNVEVLNLSHNKLVSFLDNFFTPNKKLLVLNLNDNIIEKLTKHSLFGLKHLHTLDLSQNQLINIDRNAFDSLVSLLHLNLSANQFNTIASTVFSGLANLRQLDLSKNILKQLPNGIFAGQVQLQQLWLEDTHLERLGNWVSRRNNTIDQTVLTNLRFVAIRNNRYLNEIDPVTFRCTPAIEHLILSGNRLTSLPKELGELQRLQILDVNGNLLTSIPWQIGNLGQLTQLHMLENDFSCDCRMFWIVNWLEELHARESNSTVGIDIWRNGTGIDEDVLNMQLSELKCRHGYPGDMIHVLRQLHCTKPVVLHSSESKMYLLRSDAVLECSFTGNPAPDIMWVTPTNQILRYYADPDAKPILIEHNGGETDVGGVNNIGSGGGKTQKRIEFQMLVGNNLNFTAATKAVGVSLLDNGSLKVYNISRKDSGVYTCYGYNIMGNATADIRYLLILFYFAIYKFLYLFVLIMSCT